VSGKGDITSNRRVRRKTVCLGTEGNLSLRGGYEELQEGGRTILSNRKEEELTTLRIFLWQRGGHASVFTGRGRGYYYPLISEKGITDGFLESGG